VTDATFRPSQIKEVSLFGSNLFAMTDTDGDGKMTFAEWRDSTVRSTISGEDNSMLFQQWAKYDSENVGYLTEDEAVNLVA